MAVWTPSRSFCIRASHANARCAAALACLRAASPTIWSAGCMVRGSEGAQWSIRKDSRSAPWLSTHAHLIIGISTKTLSARSM